MSQKNISSREKRQKRSRHIREICIFAMFGVLMLISKKMMEFLPNIHLLGMFCITLTVVYRVKALIPIYVYVFLNGLIEGFSMWWVPYLYIWTILWAMAMLLPKKMKTPVAVVVYPLLCALHGLLYGTLYAPAQAIMFGLSFNQTLAWIGAGLYFDAIHAIGNFFAGQLIYPVVKVLRKLEEKY